MNIIPASTARQKSIQTHTESSNGTLSKINEQINKAISKGEFFIFFYDSIQSTLVDILKQEGYKIDNLSDQRDGICYKISW